MLLLYLGDLSKRRFLLASRIFFRGDLCAAAAAIDAARATTAAAARFLAETGRVLLAARRAGAAAVPILICRAAKPASKLRGRLVRRWRRCRLPSVGWAGGRLGWLRTELSELLLDGATLVTEK